MLESELFLAPLGANLRAAVVWGCGTLHRISACFNSLLLNLMLVG